MLSTHDLESAASGIVHHTTGQHSWAAIRRLMTQLRAWYRHATEPHLTRGDVVLWQATVWDRPSITVTRTVTVIAQVGDNVLVQIRGRDGWVVRKLSREALRVRP